MPFHQDVHETMMAEGVPCGVWDEEDRRGPDRIAVEDNGYDLDCTPIDTLMRAEGMGFSVAHAMEHGDEGYDT